MRIDGNRPNADTAAAQNQKVDKAAADASRQAASGRTTASGDRVAVSSDAALANAAVKAANETPEIRTELVDRMRSLMKAGQLGNDAGKLADSLIDSMLGQK